MTIYEISFQRTDKNIEHDAWFADGVNHQHPFALKMVRIHNPELWDAKAKVYEAYQARQPLRWTHSDEEFLKIARNLIDTLSTGKDIQTPDWFTYNIDTVEGSQNSTLEIKINSHYHGDGDFSEWRTAHYFHDEKIQALSIQDEFPSSVSVSGGFTFSVVKVDATAEIKEAAKQYRIALQIEKDKADAAKHLAALCMTYIQSFDSNGTLVVAKSDYKPRGAAKQGFPKGMIGIKFWDGDSKWGSSIGVRFKNASSRDRNDNSATFAAGNKFDAYIPSCEILKDSEDDSFTVDTQYGFIGKFLSAYLFNRLYDVDSTRDGRVDNNLKFDPLMIKVLDFVKVNHANLIDLCREKFVGGIFKDYRGFSREIIDGNQPAFDAILAYARTIMG